MAYASRSETVHPGEVISTGTMPDGCGLELDRWLQPGDRVRLVVERVGELTQRIGDRS